MKYPGKNCPLLSLIGNEYLKPISGYLIDDIYYIEFQNVPSRYITNLCFGSKNSSCFNPNNATSLNLEDNISELTVSVKVSIDPSSNISLYIGNKDHIASLTITSNSIESTIYLSDTISFSSITLIGEINIQANQANQLQESTPVFDFKTVDLQFFKTTFINENIRINVDNTNTYYIPFMYENLITGTSNVKLLLTQQLNTITFDDNGWLFDYQESGVNLQHFIYKSSREIHLFSIDSDLSLINPSISEPLLTLVFPDNLTNPTPIWLSNSMGRMKFVGKYGEFSEIVKIQSQLFEFYQDGTGVLPVVAFPDSTMFINNISENVSLPSAHISNIEFFVSDSISENSYVIFEPTNFTNSILYGNDHVILKDSTLYAKTEIHETTFNNLTIELIDSNIVLSGCKLLDKVLHFNVYDVTKIAEEYVIQVDSEFLKKNHEYEVSSYGTSLPATVSEVGNNLVVRISTTSFSSVEPSETTQSEQTETTHSEQTETTHSEQTETTHSEQTETTQSSGTPSPSSPEVSPSKSSNKTKLLLGILIPFSIILIALVVFAVIIINKKRKAISTEEGNDSNFVKIL